MTEYSVKLWLILYSLLAFIVAIGCFAYKQ